ncbi:DUF2971 domain-containing protein [Iodobacter sp.]|uniref:DUF2971 domain-containing protein n=1 Tax=Iodobacter sp. TaxID=1915058 RepID=UPI0025F5E78D|nr:DUF2971 domain-containing protein [Iodobacter sp.]
MLYKYTKIDKNLSSILVDGFIFAASPNILNDPFEARICFSEQNENEYFKGESDASVREAEEKALFELNEKIRIASFSKDKNNQLLWSLYADSHKGICIGIEDSNNVLSLSKDVEYATDYPVFHYDRDESIGEFDIKILLTKAKAWKYEEERRLVMWDDDKEWINEKLRSNDCLETKFEKINNLGTKCHFGAQNIDSVILGAKISDKHKNSVLLMLAQSDVVIFQAKISRGKYELEYELCN